MHASIVRGYGQIPEYRERPEPTAQAGQLIVDVEAAAISQLVKAQVAGRHYSMSAASHPPPFVPGADGVGTTRDGRRVYFAFPQFPFGSMAAQAVARADLCVALPPGIEPARAAALANPAMSSWAALTRRAALVAGETVWVLGATGASGLLAIEVARVLGAGRVVALGRGAARFETLRARGADAVISLDDTDALADAVLAQAKIAPPAIVLDYLWGLPAAQTLLGLARAHLGAPCRWVQIGSVTGEFAQVPAGLLRSSPVTLLGSGIGSVAPQELVKVVGEVMHAADRLTVDYAVEPLRNVAAAWARPERTVLTM